MATSSDDLPEIVHPEIPGIEDVEGATVNEPGDDDDLDTELMSDFTKLPIIANDCPRTFSPIGSERTSPEQGLLFSILYREHGMLLAQHQILLVPDGTLSEPLSSSVSLSQLVHRI